MLGKVAASKLASQADRLALGAATKAGLLLPLLRRAVYLQRSRACWVHQDLIGVVKHVGEEEETTLLRTVSSHYCLQLGLQGARGQ